MVVKAEAGAERAALSRAVSARLDEEWRVWERVRQIGSGVVWAESYVKRLAKWQGRCGLGCCM